MKHARTIITLAVALLLFTGTSYAAGLKEYLSKPDDSYAYKIESTMPAGTNTVYFVQMTSQTWRGIPWKHWLVIIKPQVVKHPDKALLLIAGGDSADLPRMDRDEALALGMIAQQMNAVVAMLMQVPNEPLFDGKTEDGIIAYTFEQFLKGQGDDWPLLLPMVKSAVRAMDAVQSIAKEQFKQDIKQFMVTGASKRGWTTWLTGVADPRVIAIAPMVIDTLNMAPQMRHQLDCYGAYSDEVKDYTERGIQDAMQSDAGKRLLGIVDPYSYREALTLPKIMILGTNDEYWTIDAAKFYFNDLKGEKYLHYEPNAGHGLNLNIVPCIVAMFKEALTGQKLPQLHWQTLPDGSIEASWDNADGKAVLWQAQSPTRDFRRVKWTSAPLDGSLKATAKVAAPETGWAAYYVAVTFSVTLDAASLQADGKEVSVPMQYPYSLCTLPNVVPDTFPKHAKATK